MKIGFCGTMSVGKTTLVNELAKLPEFKDYTSRTERSKHLMDLGIPLNMDSTLKGQFVFAAERASELLCDKIITDRTVIDVMAFSELSDSMTANESFYLNSALSHLIGDYDSESNLSYRSTFSHLILFQMIMHPLDNLKKTFYQDWAQYP